MYVKGNHNTDHIVESVRNYELEGKADLVFQNTGETDVVIGVRTIGPTESFRMSGEFTILQNNPISITFKTQLGKTNSLYAHYILPKNESVNGFYDESC